RWRRQITIDITACTNNVLAPGTVRLPRNKGEGDIPLTAISTGDVDTLECLIRKVGVEDAEFTNPSGNGRMRIYRSNGEKIDTNRRRETTVKGTAVGGGDWNRYDQILFPCEGSEQLETSAAQTNFLNYVNGGGRVFATHYSYTWLFQNGALANTAAWQVG